MTDLATRVRDGLGNDWDATPSPWEGLMKLYEADREAFYLLAREGADETDQSMRPLADLARRVHAAVQSTYRIEQSGEDGLAAVKTRSGEPLTVPGRLLPRVKSFLLEIDGKRSSNEPGSDYQGRPVSEAEVWFKLSDPKTSEREPDRARARREAKPVVLKLAKDDLKSLATQPAYVTHGLFQCARKTVLAPAAVYKGLNRGNDAPERLTNGWAICGKPNRAYDNHGQKLQPPDDMLYMVYATADGFVFDWDWVPEDPHDPGHPLDNTPRFGNLVPEPEEFVLDLPHDIPTASFDSSTVACSSPGDCAFCYIRDDPSFGTRINGDLTVFYSLDKRDEITGFKIKNVLRILREEKALNLSDAPGLDVLILPTLRKTLHDHQEVTIKLYEVIIAALVGVRIPMKELAPDEVAFVTAG